MAGVLSLGETHREDEDGDKIRKDIRKDSQEEGSSPTNPPTTAQNSLGQQFQEEGAGLEVMIPPTSGGLSAPSPAVNKPGQFWGLRDSKQTHLLPKP